VKDLTVLGKGGHLSTDKMCNVAVLQRRTDGTVRHCRWGPLCGHAF